MKKAFRKSKSKSTNFVKRVLSKTNSLNTSDPSLGNVMQMEEEKPPVNIEMELFSLKKQIDGLQKSVNVMQYDNEKKEAALAKLARDKEQLHVDLNKQRRSNTNLKQQLEDERTFYYKEKEQYCAEMHETKKIKQKLNQTGTNSEYNLKEIFKQKEESLQNEIDDLKERINITLEANYNLSIKFLRMKNTKFCFKNRLKRLQMNHDAAMEEFKEKLEKVEKELVDIVRKEFLTPITPSSKKYLQLIKYNGQLIHENLALQQHTERLQLQLDKIKMQQVREETNKKLQYYRKRSKSEGPSRISHKLPADVTIDKQNNDVRKTTEKIDGQIEQIPIGSKKTEKTLKEFIDFPCTGLPIISTPLRTSPSLDIQTLYERKKSSSQKYLPSSISSVNNLTINSSKPSPKGRRRPPISPDMDEYSNSCCITIQPLDNSKAVTLPADVVASYTNLRLLCKNENEGSESASNWEGVDSREGSSNCGRGLTSSTSTEVGGGKMVPSLNLLQVSNSTSTSNQNTEVSFYTSIYNESRPQSAPPAGSRGTTTGVD